MVCICKVRTKILPCNRSISLLYGFWQFYEIPRRLLYIPYSLDAICKIYTDIHQFYNWKFRSKTQRWHASSVPCHIFRISRLIIVSAFRALISSSYLASNSKYQHGSCVNADLFFITGKCNCQFLEEIRIRKNCKN